MPLLLVFTAVVAAVAIVGVAAVFPDGQLLHLRV